MYSNQETSVVSFTDRFSGNPLSPHHHVGISSNKGRNETMIIPHPGDSVGMQSPYEQLSDAPGSNTSNSVMGQYQAIQKRQLGMLNGEQAFQLQGLSLRLGSDLSPAVSSFQYHQSKDLVNPDYLSCGITGMDPPFLGSTKVMHFDANLYEPLGFTNNILNSKYLKAAQEMLDEVVDVRNALKQSDLSKNQNKSDFPNAENRNFDSDTNERASDPDGPNDKSSSGLLSAERQDLENKKLKLLSMLDEVDRRYRQYQHQMHSVVSSFDRLAGFGASKPYTVLALQTISRHFRCLRDAIREHIQVTQRSLGEKDNSSISEGNVIPRLRYVDHQLRQKRAFQHLGVMCQSWRPQRGLPENAVSILRAWLFEHFLHPYPNDSEKITLARQTGLSRHQVANWFINARVRLWKPMIEEMYKEEFGDPEMNSSSSLENMSKAPKDQSSTSKNNGEELQDTVTSVAAGRAHIGQLDLKTEKSYEVEIHKSTRTVLQCCAEGDNKGDCKVLLPQDNQISSDDCNLGSGDFAFGNRVSLDLGLQHCEYSGFFVSGGRYSEVSDATMSSVGPDNDGYQGSELGQLKHRFGNQHLLNDFIV